MALSVLRIHSETVCLLVLALASIARSSSGVTRTRKVPAFALPFGSGGRPAFLVFLCRLKASELLNDCCPYRENRGRDRVNMQNGYMASRLLRIAHVMRPSIGPWCFWMAYKIEHLNDTLPHCLSLESLFDRHTFDVL